MKKLSRIADCGLRIEESGAVSAAFPFRNPQSAIRNFAAGTQRSVLTTPPSILSGFTLLEVILVLALIGIAAALLMPSVNSAFATYQLERAAEDLQYRLARTRLQAMEQGVPYAFSYRPEGDQFMIWACEPLSLSSATSGAGTIAGGSVTGAAISDTYDRHNFELNDKPDNREFRFLSTSLSESLTTMGLGLEARAGMASSASAESVSASGLLSQHKLGLASPSARSTAALQIPGLQLGDVIEPLVFEPDGTADRDAIIRIADRSNRYVEVTVQGLTGSVTTSSTQTVENLVASGKAAGNGGSEQSRTTFAAPSRSREIRTGGN